VKGDGCEQFKILLSLCNFQTTRPPTRAKLGKIKKIKLNQNFKPAYDRTQKEKTGVTSVAKKTQFVKTIEYVEFLTQHHKHCFTHICLRHERIPFRIF
jgi:hypothetical protein